MAVGTVTWAAALAWRLGRQGLHPVGSGSVADVVRRLGAVPAWPDQTAELAVACRRAGGRVGDTAAALAAGEVVKAYTFHGATHLMTPSEAGDHLAVRASGRMWELPSWQSHYELAPADWPAFRAHVRDVLADGPVTHPELVAALRRSHRHRRAADVLAEGNDTLIKPLTWQGDLVLGPARDGAATYRRADSVPGWTGLPDLDRAGPRLVAAYVGTYGPVAAQRVRDRFGQGLRARRGDPDRWLAALGPQLATLRIEGEEVLVRAEDLDDVRRAAVSDVVRLLPARDPWVLATGSDDGHVLPPAHRDVVSRARHLVVHGGTVAGTWAARGGHLTVTWFAGAASAPAAALESEAARLAGITGRPLPLALVAS